MSESEVMPLTIIGAGVGGSATLHELSEEIRQIVFVERNPLLYGDNQTSRSSGVVHAGIYYDAKRQPIKAATCVEGNALMYQFAKSHGVPCKAVGKLVVATTNEEESVLDRYHERAMENGVPGVRRISAEEVAMREPNVRARSALYLPSSGIIDPIAYIKALQCAAEKRAEIHKLMSTRVVAIEPRSDHFELTVETLDPMSQEATEIYSFKSRVVVNAAGLYSDDIARKVNPQSPHRIAPAKGEAAQFFIRRPDLRVSMNVYPTPTTFLSAEGKQVETLGVHLTPTLDEEGNLTNTVTVGPLNSAAASKEDFRDTNPVERFHYKVAAFFPHLQPEDLELHQVGVQAKRQGATRGDFIVEHDPRHAHFINLIAIDSPGLTASLALAKRVRQMVATLRP